MKLYDWIVAGAAAAAASALVLALVGGLLLAEIIGGAFALLAILTNGR